MECIKAAVLNGADAVYIGAKDFSARASAENFSREELFEAVSYCHARGAKVHLTLNTLVFDSEIKRVEQCIKDAAECGIDAFIVQDRGIIELIKSICPNAQIHASTQMTVHTAMGANELKRIGATRAVLARELSLKEIEAIRKSTDIELEVFVHGALCMSVSGQCYISGMIGGRSGNRGKCAGTCRLPFKTNGSSEEYMLSLKDSCTTEYIKKLCELNIDSLKIEGRMKRPEYVAAAAAAYRQAIDGITPDITDLQSVFSRSGFTSAYLKGEYSQDMFGIRRKDDVTSATASLLKSLKNTYKGESENVLLDMKLTAKRGEKLVLFASDRDGNSETAYAPPAEDALNKPTDEEMAVGRLKKLGGTVFMPGNIAAYIDKGLMLPASVINELRRTVCESIEKQRAQITPIPVFKKAEALNAVRKTEAFSDGVFKNTRELRARFLTVDQITETSSLSKIILPVDEVYKNMDKLSDIKAKVIVELPRIIFSGEERLVKVLEQLKQNGFEQVECNNIGELYMARELSLTAHGGAFLNCTNSESAAGYAADGLCDITLSFETPQSELKTIASPIEKGAVIYGKLPLMIYRACPVKQRIGCAKCGKKAVLTDRLNKQFPLLCRGDYSELLNGDTLYMADRLSELHGVSYFVLYFTNETKEAVSVAVRSAACGAAPIGGHTRGLYYRSI